MSLSPPYRLSRRPLFRLLPRFHPQSQSPPSSPPALESSSDLLHTRLSAALVENDKLRKEVARLSCEVDRIKTCQGSAENSLGLGGPKRERSKSTPETLESGSGESGSGRSFSCQWEGEEGDRGTTSSATITKEEGEKRKPIRSTIRKGGGGKLPKQMDSNPLHRPIPNSHPHLSTTITTTSIPTSTTLPVPALSEEPGEETHTASPQLPKPMHEDGGNGPCRPPCRPPCRLREHGGDPEKSPLPCPTGKPEADPLPSAPASPAPEQGAEPVAKVAESRGGGSCPVGPTASASTGAAAELCKGCVCEPDVVAADAGAAAGVALALQEEGAEENTLATKAAFVPQEVLRLERLEEQQQLQQQLQHRNDSNAGCEHVEGEMGEEIEQENKGRDFKGETARLEKELGESQMENARVRKLVGDLERRLEAMKKWNVDIREGLEREKRGVEKGLLDARNENVRLRAENVKLRKREGETVTLLKGVKTSVDGQLRGFGLDVGGDEEEADGGRNRQVHLELVRENRLLRERGRHLQEENMRMYKQGWRKGGEGEDGVMERIERDEGGKEIDGNGKDVGKVAGAEACVVTFDW